MSGRAMAGVSPRLGSRGATLLMSASAALTTVPGLAMSFAPQELAAASGHAHDALLALVLQVLGALYLGAALTNWMARKSLIGGIFGRPLALGNLAHFAIGALALAKAAPAQAWPAPVWLATAIYGVLALAFGALVFRHPGLSQCG